MNNSNWDIFNIEDNFKKYSHVESILIKSSEINNPDITIFVPTYKRTSTLSQTLDSILGQEGLFRYEILLLDNNPERGDETELLIQQQYKHVSQLSYYKNAENIGMIGNWNRGYELAKSEWVAMVHDDDCLFEDSICKALHIIRQLDNKLDALFLNHVFDMRKVLANIGYIKKLSLFDFFMDNYGTIVGVMMKRNMVMSLGGFSDEFYPAADYHFWCMIAKYKTSYRVLNIPCAYYRIGDNTSRNPSIIKLMIDSAARIQRGILYHKCNSKIIRLIGSQWLEYWSYMYLYSWKKLFANNDSIKDVNILIDETKERVSILAKIVGVILNYVYAVYNRFRDKIIIQF